MTEGVLGGGGSAPMQYSIAESVEGMEPWAREGEVKFLLR